jgi:hypothetical protein
MIIHHDGLRIVDMWTAHTNVLGHPSLLLRHRVSLLDL